jgi:hypothetical protein
MGTGGEIINLNVGGQRFSTSRHTLTAIPVSVLYQGCGSGLDPDSVTLWIRSVLGIRIPDPDPGAIKFRNFSGKIPFLVPVPVLKKKKFYH